MKNIIFPLSIFVVLIVLTSCRENTTNTPESEDFSTPVEISDKALHINLPSGLNIDAYELKGPHSVEPTIFDPVFDSQEQILKKHAEERKQRFPDNTFFGDTGLGMTAQLDDRELIAREVYTTYNEPELGSPSSSSIEILLDDEVIYTADAGEGSPLNPLQGLWSYDQDWFLEYAYVKWSTDEGENTMFFNATGHLVKNGALLNEQYSYDEIFGFQLMKGRPFYFFERDGQIGVSYDEQITMLGYDEIPHYGCCSASLLNPNQAENMVSFLAQKDGIWYYIEIGSYE